MKNWIKHTLVGVAATAALAGSLAAWSETGTTMSGHWHGGPPSAADMASHEAAMLAHIGKTLSLNTAQQAKLQALADQLHAQHDAFMQAGGDPHARMAALIAGNTFDRSSAQTLVNQAVAQLQSSSPLLINAAGDFFDSLNATQQQQVRDFMAQHHSHMEHHAPAASTTN